MTSDDGTQVGSSGDSPFLTVDEALERLPTREELRRAMGADDAE